MLDTVEGREPEKEYQAEVIFAIEMGKENVYSRCIVNLSGLFGCFGSLNRG